MFCFFWFCLSAGGWNCQIFIKVLFLYFVLVYETRLAEQTGYVFLPWSYNDKGHSVIVQRTSPLRAGVVTGSIPSHGWKDLDRDAWCGISQWSPRGGLAQRQVGVKWPKKKHILLLENELAEENVNLAHRKRLHLAFTILDTIMTLVNV